MLCIVFLQESLDGVVYLVVEDEFLFLKFELLVIGLVLEILLTPEKILLLLFSCASGQKAFVDLVLKRLGVAFELAALLLEFILACLIFALER